MSDSKQTVTSGGIGFGGLLTLIFVAAKLWDKIDWSWIWVFSPLWIPAGIAVSIMIVAGTVALFAFGVGSAAEMVQARRTTKARVERAKKLGR